MNPLPDITTHEAAFEAFVAPYLVGECLPLRVKREHSLMVLEKTRQIMAREDFNQQVSRALSLAALYHDVGRFPQYTRWHTFDDATSENHGTLAVGLIKKQGFLANEPQSLTRLVLAAIAMHNRRFVPSGLEPNLRMVTEALRDADKLDIFRVIAQHLTAAVPSSDVVLRVADEPERWSPALVETVLNGQTPSYADMNYINDFRILLGAWMWQLCFDSSRSLLAHSGHVEAVLAGLPQNPDLDAVKACLYTQLEAAKRIE